MTQNFLIKMTQINYIYAYTIKNQMRPENNKRKLNFNGILRKYLNTNGPELNFTKRNRYTHQFVTAH